MSKQNDQLLIALETERRFLAKELHDGVAQTTLQVGLQVGLCRKLLEADKLDLLADELAVLEERNQLASSQVKQIISDMRPPRVEPDANLEDYIQHSIDMHLEQGGPPVSFQNDWTDWVLNFSPTQMITFVRIVDEALLNVRKHAEARQIQLMLSTHDDSLLMNITDDGCGFDPVEVESRPVDKGGAGLANLHARAEALGGTLSISRNILGQGIKVTLMLPK